MSMSTGNVSQLGQVLRRAAIEARYETARQLERAVDEPGSGDRLEISTDGRDMARLRAVLGAGMQALPDVRDDRVAQVRDRVMAGFYDREDVVGQISDRMLEQGTLKEVANSTTPPIENTEYREELMTEVNHKIQSGFYTDKEVMKFVADRLMNIYQIDSQDDGV